MRLTGWVDSATLLGLLWASGYREGSAGIRSRRREPGRCAFVLPSISVYDYLGLTQHTAFLNAGDVDTIVLYNEARSP